MGEIVKIEYEGKEYIGFIKSIENIVEFARPLGTNKRMPSFICYTVSLYDKDTFCTIENIEINSLDEIQRVKGGDI